MTQLHYINNLATFQFGNVRATNSECVVAEEEINMQIAADIEHYEGGRRP